MNLSIFEIIAIVLAGAALEVLSYPAFRQRYVPLPQYWACTLPDILTSNRKC